MISRIEALNYRCLRYVDQNLEPFQLLVGANATGKMTFLDVLGFLTDVEDQTRLLATLNHTSEAKGII